MLDSSQKMLEFLAPLAAVVYIIVAVIAFLLRNQERLEHEVEQERRDALPENPAARPRAGGGHQGGRPTVVLPSETEGESRETPNLHDAAVAHPYDAAGAGTDLRRVSNEDKGLPPTRVEFSQ